MTPADVLREARKLVAQGWTQGWYARGRTGRKVDESGRSATCWCVLGSIRRAGSYSEDAYRAFGRAIGANVGKFSYSVDIVGWNDAPGRTQAEVLAAFDRAIELVEGPR